MSRVVTSAYKKIGCLFEKSRDLSYKSFLELQKLYGFVDANSEDNYDFDLIITLGGDGMMLRALHKYMNKKIPIYGMNRGSLGFLLNKYNVENLIERINSAVKYTLYPLEMKVVNKNNEQHTKLAINEVSLLRETSQTAKIRVLINGEERIGSLVCDGLLVSTAAGSTAYNFAANGPILPLNSNALALTPICPFRPRRWRGAILPHDSKISLEVLESGKRPVSAVADSEEFRDVVKIEILEKRKAGLTILFDKDNNLEQRILEEQFTHG